MTKRTWVKNDLKSLYIGQTNKNGTLTRPFSSRRDGTLCSDVEHQSGAPSQFLGYVHLDVMLLVQA